MSGATKGAHTPGPWTVAEHVDASDNMLPLALHVERENDDGSVRCVARAFPNLYENRTDNLAEETRANARLIAAAPALLEAFRLFVARVEDCNTSVPDPVLSADIDAACAALALVEGGDR